MAEAAVDHHVERSRCRLFAGDRARLRALHFADPRDARIEPGLDHAPQYVALSEDPGEPPALHHEHGTHVVVIHEAHGVGNGRIGCDGDDVRPRLRGKQIGNGFVVHPEA